MEWRKIAEIAITCIASVGGISAIIVWVIKVLSDSIADRLSKKYQLQLDKEIEKYKSILSKKEYVSKTRFEAEYRMYQEISVKNISVVYCAGEASVIAKGSPYSENEIDAFIERYCKCLNDAALTNKKYAPFINKDTYEKYRALENEVSEIFRLVKAWKQYRSGEDFGIIIAGSTYHSQSEVAQAIIEKQRQTSKDSDALIRDLRDYLYTLEVMED